MGLTLLGSVKLMQGATEGEPPPPHTSGPMATAILPDGSLFAASQIVSNFTHGQVRMWHLSSDLTVLGQANVEHPIGIPDEYRDRRPVPFAVWTTAMNVLLLMEMLGDDDDGTTWLYSSIVDCSGDVPVPGAETAISTDQNKRSWTGGWAPIAIRDEVNDRLIVAGARRAPFVI